MILAGVALGFVMAGCGSSATAPRIRSLPPGSLTTTAPVKLLAGQLAAIGTAQHVTSQGAALTVTVERVIDPLRGSGAALESGTRAVGVLVEISNAGPAIYDSSATGDFALAASAGPVTPVLATRGICRTPLNDFDSYIEPGERRSGCVVLAVPSRAEVTAVRFDPHAGVTGRLSWSP